MSDDDETLSLTKPMPEASGPTEPDVDPAPAPSAAAALRRSARLGTILWGVLLLVFAATMAVSVLPAFDVDPTTLVLGACIAAGVLLVTAGVVTMVARSREDEYPQE